MTVDVFRHDAVVVQVLQQRPALFLRHALDRHRRHLAHIQGLAPAAVVHPRNRLVDRGIAAADVGQLVAGAHLPRLARRRHVVQRVAAVEDGLQGRRQTVPGLVHVAEHGVAADLGQFHAMQQGAFRRPRRGRQIGMPLPSHREALAACFIVGDQQNFRMFGMAKFGNRRMIIERAEVTAERDVLLERQRLVAEQQDDVAMPGIDQRLHRLGIQRTAHVDADHFGAQRRRQWFQGKATHAASRGWGLHQFVSVIFIFIAAFKRWVCANCQPRTKPCVAENSSAHAGIRRSPTARTA